MIVLNHKEPLLLISKCKDTKNRPNNNWNMFFPIIYNSIIALLWQKLHFSMINVKTTLSKRTPSDPVATMPERAKGCFLSLF